MLRYSLLITIGLSLLIGACSQLTTPNSLNDGKSSLSLQGEYSFGLDGYDKDGYDAWGYNKEGYDRLGFDVKGFDKDGYDVWGYDVEGFDRAKEKRQFLGRSKILGDVLKTANSSRNLRNYNYEVWKEKTAKLKGEKSFILYDYSPNGYDKDGFDVWGYDKEGYNMFNYDIKDFNRKGYDAWGYNKEGYDKEGYDIKGYNIKGYDREGRFMNLSHPREYITKAQLYRQGIEERYKTWKEEVTKQRERNKQNSNYFMFIEPQRPFDDLGLGLTKNFDKFRVTDGQLLKLHRAIKFIEEEKIWGNSSEWIGIVEAFDQLRVERKIHNLDNIILRDLLRDAVKKAKAQTEAAK